MSAATRFSVKKGVKDALLATFDVSQLPSGSLTDLTIEWYVKRTLTQSGYDMQKSSTDASQIAVVNAALGTVHVFLVPADTTALPPGDYYYTFRLFNTVGDLITISPDTTHGDLILLASAYM